MLPADPFLFISPDHIQLLLCVINAKRLQILRSSYGINMKTLTIMLQHVLWRSLISCEPLGSLAEPGFPALFFCQLLFLRHVSLQIKLYRFSISNNAMKSFVTPFSSLLNLSRLSMAGGVPGDVSLT